MAMEDIWHALEEHTRAWNALERQGLADSIWADYVTVRFGRTGDPRALEFLYPYLNHAHRETRLRAIEVAARVYEGRGPRAIGGLDYFVKHPDLFVRDRAVQVLGAAVTGSPDRVILEVLGPYLNHPNRFIRKLAVVALGRAAAGRGSTEVLAEIQRVAGTSAPRQDEVDMAIATTFTGRPTEEVYALVAGSKLADHGYGGNERAVSVLVRGASDEWYARAVEEVFGPLLHAEGEMGWRKILARRAGIAALCRSAVRRGMEPLERMMHLRGERCTGLAMLRSAPACFTGADINANRPPLVDLVRNGDVPGQRVAALCLGRMAMGSEDGESIDTLRALCDAKNGAVQAAALTGLGMAAKSTCDSELRKLCMGHVSRSETGASAIRALGMEYVLGRSTLLRAQSGA